MSLVLFFIGLIAVLISAFYISFKVHKALSVKGDIIALFASLLAFIVSLIGIGVVVLFIWAELTGGFSRR